MPFTFTCDECGREFTRKQQNYHGCTRKFCGRECRVAYTRKHPEATKRDGKLPHDMVTICITTRIGVFPELMPRVGARYIAERYQNTSKTLRYSYVISVRGKRIIVRPEECTEI